MYTVEPLLYDHLIANPSARHAESPNVLLLFLLTLHFTIVMGVPRELHALDLYKPLMYVMLAV